MNQSPVRSNRQIALTTKNVPALTAKMPDHELWTSFFRDPDNHLFALTCEKRPGR